MKSFVFSFFGCCFCLLLTPMWTLATSSPEDSLRTIIEQVKATGEPKIVLENVHWPTAYQNLSESQRQAMKVASSEELRKYYTNLFENPAAVISARLADYTKDLNSDSQKMSAEQIAQVSNLMKAQIAQAKQKLKNVQYQIGKADIQENRALIKLTSTFEGKNRESYIKMILVGDRWMFPSLDLVATTSGIK